MRPTPGSVEEPLTFLAISSVRGLIRRPGLSNIKLSSWLKVQRLRRSSACTWHRETTMVSSMTWRCGASRMCVLSAGRFSGLQTAKLRPQKGRR